MNGNPEARVPTTKAIILSNGTVLFPVHRTRPPMLRNQGRPALVLRLPRTRQGQEALREFHRICDAWEPREGYDVQATDWDELPDLIRSIEASQDRYAQDYYDWCLAQGRGVPW